MRLLYWSLPVSDPNTGPILEATYTAGDLAEGKARAHNANRPCDAAQSLSPLAPRR